MDRKKRNYKDKKLECKRLRQKEKEREGGRERDSDREGERVGHNLA